MEPLKFEVLIRIINIICVIEDVLMYLYSIQCCIKFASYNIAEKRVSPTLRLPIIKCLFIVISKQKNKCRIWWLFNYFSFYFFKLFFCYDKELITFNFYLTWKNNQTQCTILILILNAHRRLWIKDYRLPNIW